MSYKELLNDLSKFKYYDPDDQGAKKLINENSDVKTPCSITRPADGDQIHLLGAFYDANHENFINGRSLFRRDIRDKAKVDPKKSYSLNHTFKKSLNEILEIFGLSGGLAVRTKFKGTVAVLSLVLLFYYTGCFKEFPRRICRANLIIFM
uniref:Uncharacterized protein n=1 Tax=Panagrolaimus davidi TaxID=227884 RepID=A0A914QB36_9BILA